MQSLRKTFNFPLSKKIESHQRETVFVQLPKKLSLKTKNNQLSHDEGQKSGQC